MVLVRLLPTDLAALVRARGGEGELSVREREDFSGPVGEPEEDFAGLKGEPQQELWKAGGDWKVSAGKPGADFARIVYRCDAVSEEIADGGRKRDLRVCEGEGC